MNRKGFLRSIFVVAAAPKIMMDLQTKSIATFISSGSPIDQNFFNVAFSQKVDDIVRYKECYNIDVLLGDTMNAWMTKFNDQEF